MFKTIRKGFAIPFRMPNIQGRRYAPGPQPNSPGESCSPYGTYYHAVPWPNAVGTVGALANFAGVARGQPIGIVNNAVATLPTENLFIGGFVAKSRG